MSFFFFFFISWYDRLFRQLLFIPDKNTQISIGSASDFGLYLYCEDPTDVYGNIWQRAGHRSLHV